MKKLLLDIETAPNEAHIWGLFKQTVSINQIINSGYVLCWAAKWADEKEVMFDSVFKSSRRRMIGRIHKLLTEADVVIHYNGKSFDLPTLNKEIILLGMAPPAPYQQIDLLLVARDQFRFTSNKLDYVCQQLGLGKKTHHKGHQLWIDCMAKNPAAWATMERYNRNDVVILERLYNRMKPWIKQHANHSLYEADSKCCPKCGSTAFQARGWSYTQAGQYRRFQCMKCYGWFRGVCTVAPKARDRFANL